MFKISKIFMRLYSLVILPILSSKNIVLIANGIGTFDGNPKPIFLKSKELKNSKFEYYWIEQNRDNYKKLSKIYSNVVYAFSLKGLYLISRAYFYVVSVSSQDIYPGLKIPNNRVMIQSWHGIPVKKFCKLADSVYTQKSIKKQIQDCFNPQNTYILVSSDYETKAFKENCDFPKNRVLEFGHPRYDDINLLKNSNVSNKKGYEKIILYSPTFRENNDFKLFPFSDMSIEEFNAFLNENKYLLIIKVHPLHSDMLKDFTELSNIIKYSSLWGLDNFELFETVDILITDYSSIALDFLVTGKPVAYLQYDFEEYIKTRPIPLGRDIMYPGPNISNYTEFQDIIKKLFTDNNFYKTERTNTIQFFFKYNDFHASERVFKFIENYKGGK